jgi:hypothetical protein
VDDVDRVLADYPQVYFACHLRRQRDARSPRVLSQRQASVLDRAARRQETGHEVLAESVAGARATQLVPRGLHAASAQLAEILSRP